MKYASISAAPGKGNATRKNVESTNGWWVQFGDTQLIYAASDKWSQVSLAIGRGELLADGDIKKGNMHLVVQKGRTFQQEHPDVPVILDKGRYLVVDLPKDEARKLVRDDETCFGIEPLRENSVAFVILDPEPATARSATSDLVAALDQAVYAADLGQLVGHPTRLSISQGYQDAANWCEARLSAMGYVTSQTPVSVPGMGQSTNVLATKPGTAANPLQVIVVAHLDSVNHPGGPNAAAPGADDNASGSAGVLALAQAMSTASFEHDLTFILFGGEEQGLHGSRQYVAAMGQPDKDRTKAVLNMDMIGHVNTATQTVLLEGAPLSQSQINALASAATQFTSLTVQSSLNPFASDHVPFIDAGIPAVLTIEGADSANDAIHTGNDTLDRVDPEFAMEILRMNAAFVAEQAGVIAIGAPPQPDDCGCGCGGASDEKNQLALHYQMLLAQYARLSVAGGLNSDDLQRMQYLRAEYDQLIGRTQR